MLTERYLFTESEIYRSNAYIDFLGEKSRAQRHRQRGFSLIELSIVMVIIGLIVAAVMGAAAIALEKKKISNAKLALSTLDEALQDFYTANGRFPCPAPADARPESPEFGREVVCDGGAHTGTTTTAGRDGMKVRIGTVPVRTLNLPSGDIQDPWMNRITYAVTEAWADEDRLNDPAGGGAIDVHDGDGNSVLSPAASARYVIVEHGANAVGAMSFAGMLKRPCDGEGRDTENCNGDSVFVATDISEGEPNQYYDDYVAYGKPAAIIPPPAPIEDNVANAVDKIIDCNGKRKFYDIEADKCVSAPTPSCSCSAPKPSAPATPSTPAPATPTAEEEPETPPRYYLQTLICSLPYAKLGENGGDPAVAVLNCYKSYLGRCADSSGLTYWTSRILNSGASVADICNSIKSGGEAAAYKASGNPQVGCPPGYKYVPLTNYCDPI